MIYVDPSRWFEDHESENLAKIQIDNCFRLGVEKDIVLVTNFEYEYRGIKPIILGDETCCKFDIRASKIFVIVDLFDRNLIEDELYWIHDLDAYQLLPIEEDELGLGEKDLALTDYGWRKKCNTGSFFFNRNSGDIFRDIMHFILENGGHEEGALDNLIKNNNNNIKDRYKMLNIRYNIGMSKLPYIVKKAIKPIKVLHFHPEKRDILSKFKPLMTEGLLEIFKIYGYN